MDVYFERESSDSGEEFEKYVPPRKGLPELWVLRLIKDINTWGEHDSQAFLKRLRNLYEVTGREPSADQEQKFAELDEEYYRLSRRFRKASLGIPSDDIFANLLGNDEGVYTSLDAVRNDQTVWNFEDAEDIRLKIKNPPSPTNQTDAISNLSLYTSHEQVTQLRETIRLRLVEKVTKLIITDKQHDQDPLEVKHMSDHGVAEIDTDIGEWATEMNNLHRKSIEYVVTMYATTLQARLYSAQKQHDLSVASSYFRYLLLNLEIEHSLTESQLDMCRRTREELRGELYKMLSVVPTFTDAVNAVTAKAISCYIDDAISPAHRGKEHKGSLVGLVGMALTTAFSPMISNTAARPRAASDTP